MINEIIRVKEMYHLYNSEISENIKGSKEAINNLEQTKTYLLGNIESCKDFIKIYTKVDFNKIKDLYNPLPKFYFSSHPSLTEYSDRSYNLISLIIQTNILLNKEKNILRIEESKQIDFTAYKKIIEIFNKKISKEILKGYSFRMGNRLANIRIKKQILTENSKKRIDWKESKALRDDFISKGILPYKVMEYDSMKRPLVDNGGEKWFVYHNQPIDYIWYWEKQNCKILNVKIFKFRPTVNSNTVGGKYELGNANKLKQLQKEDSEVLRYFNV